MRQFNFAFPYHMSTFLIEKLISSTLHLSAILAFFFLHQMYLLGDYLLNLESGID